MSDFIVLACPSCAGNLCVTSDLERFACSHCGREHLVKRGGGHISLIPFVQQLDRIGGGVDRQAAELAIRRLREDRQEVNKQIEGAKIEMFASREAMKNIYGKSTAQIVCGVGCIIFTFWLLQAGALCFALPAVVLGACLIVAGISSLTLQSPLEAK